MKTKSQVIKEFAKEQGLPVTDLGTHPKFTVIYSTFNRKEADTLYDLLKATGNNLIFYKLSISGTDWKDCNYSQWHIIYTPQVGQDSSEDIAWVEGFIAAAKMLVPSVLLHGGGK